MAAVITATRTKTARTAGVLTTEETALVVRRLEQAERMPGILGAQSQIERDDKRYSVLGDAIIYNGSHRTAHVDYLIVRS